MASEPKKRVWGWGSMFSGKALDAVIVILVLLIILVICMGRIVRENPPEVKVEPTEEKKSTEPKEDVTSSPTTTSQSFTLLNWIVKVDARVESGKPYFDVRTNLPDGMLFLFTVENKIQTMGQVNAEVKGGNMSVGPFSKMGGPYPPGEYTVELTSTLLLLQPAEVERALGESWKNLHDEHIHNGCLSLTIPFTVQGSPRQLEAIAKLKAKERQPLQEHLSFLVKMESELTEVATAENFNKSVWAQWSTDWNERLRVSEEAYHQKLGPNINEYRGHYGKAFFDIGVGYGELFWLWCKYRDYFEHRASKSSLDTDISEFEQILHNAQSALDDNGKT